MSKIATLLFSLLLCESAFSSEGIKERLEYINAKFEILNQLGNACDYQLALAKNKGIDSDECKKYVKSIQSNVYKIAINDCENLLDYYDKNISLVGVGSELYKSNPKEFRKINFETASIIKSCSPEVIASSYKTLTQPLERIKVLKEL